MDPDTVLEWAVMSVPALLVAGPIALALWLSFRSGPNIRNSARAAATALSLPEQPAPHRRMQVFAGTLVDLRVEVASHADLFAMSEPVPLRHMYARNIVVRALFAKPLATAFRIDSTRGAEQNFDSSLVGLHPIFKIRVAAPATFERLLEPAPLREAIQDLFGATPDGSGRIVRIDERGVYVYYDSPRPEMAAQLAQQVVRTAHLLMQRAAFMPAAERSGN